VAQVPELAAAASPVARSSGLRIDRSHRRRRPSGEPPPLPRQLNWTAWTWLAVTLVLIVLSIVFTRSRFAGTLDVVDHQILSWFADIRTQPLTRVATVFASLASSLALQVLWLASLAVLLFFRRWRQLFAWIVGMFVVSNGTALQAALLHRPRPLGIEIIGSWEGFAMPSQPIAVLTATLVNILYAMFPRGQLRQIGKGIAAGIVLLVALAQMYLGVEAVSDLLLGAAIGVVVPLLAFRLLAPGEVFPVTYRRGRAAHLDLTPLRLEAIRRALEDQLGVVLIDVKPFGLEGSGGSTPLRIKVKGDPDAYLFGKLYAATHLRSDRWYKLGRTLLYGGMEDEKPFNSVRRLVQYEDYALRLLHAAGLPVPEPMGIVEITPEREYLVVMEFFEGAVEIGDAEVDDAIIDQGLLLVRRLWEAGLAHRDIKPANLLVRGGRLLLIDSAFTEVRPSPWRQAVDLANMMLVLALRTDAARVYERALQHFSVDEIAEAFAATRGLTMPSQLRHMMRAQGRDLHAEFKRLLPYPVRPIAIQRWSMRRVGLSLLVLLGGTLALLVSIQMLESPL
jgi:tRNA A-37 threonylcarbamoyl transferase component Bud32/membrane-associated phospholipid phosphatase